MQKINFKENNTPSSIKFDDIYYNIDNGLAEKHYVFIKGNNLDSIFTNLTKDYRVLELGFGTGLSFLLTAIEFLKSNKNTTTHLYFTSTELYPIDFYSLEKALKTWQELYNDDFTQEFLKQYKQTDLCSNIEILIENIHLKVLVGDAVKTLYSITQKQDCFYLDGFAPSKNPVMWSKDIFKHINRLSQPNSTLSTYTVSRKVKDIITFAGFSYKKIKGYGKKREMIIGTKNNL